MNLLQETLSLSLNMLLASQKISAITLPRHAHQIQAVLADYSDSSIRQLHRLLTQSVELAESEISSLLEGYEDVIDDGDNYIPTFTRLDNDDQFIIEKQEFIAGCEIVIASIEADYINLIAPLYEESV